MLTPDISREWFELMKDELEKPYFSELHHNITDERSRCIILPPHLMVYEAYKLTSFSNVKVVIVGQDPYHGIGQAHGLSFSVLEGVSIPPSLKNIYKELKSDLPGINLGGGNLTSWAKQGVFLINSVLTVRHKSPNSHQKMGWETFTDATIALLSEKREHLVFLLWGNYAQSKKSLINSSKHLVLEAPHPSPFSAHKGFFGCRHFSKTNAYLAEHRIDPVHWSVPDKQLVFSGF